MWYIEGKIGGLTWIITTLLLTPSTSFTIAIILGALAAIIIMKLIHPLLNPKGNKNETN